MQNTPFVRYPGKGQIIYVKWWMENETNCLQNDLKILQQPPQPAFLSVIESIGPKQEFSKITCLAHGGRTYMHNIM